MGEYKLYIQTVYIPRENILFLDEWMNHHKNLGVDEFWMYDNSGSTFKDFVGNLQVDGMDKYGNEVMNLTSHLSDNDILNLETEIFKKYNAKKISWTPKSPSGEITYGQVESIYHFKNEVSFGFCCFIDIDEFIILNKFNNIKDYISNVYKEDYQGIVIKQKKYASRWENPSNVLSINKTFNFDTTHWAPKVIANIEKITRKNNTNIHTFIDKNIIDNELCYFKHFNHNINGHNWLLSNYEYLDKNWIPKNFNDVWE
jgi:hypothetical protein